MKKMAASRVNSSSWRICRRYKFFFYICFLVLSIQLFLGYSFYSANKEELSKLRRWRSDVDHRLKGWTLTPPLKPDSHELIDGNIRPGYLPPVDPTKSVNLQELLRQTHKPPRPPDNPPPGGQLDSIKPDEGEPCPEVTSREGLSAMARAKTDECKAQLAQIECKSQRGELFPASLPNTCHLKVEHAAGAYLGCYRDNQKERDLGSFNTAFTTDNTPRRCRDFCTQGSYLYAGLQFQKECWCGNKFGRYGTLPESSCNTPCPGNRSESCGGYNAQRVFSTGLAAMKKNAAEFVLDEGIMKQKPVRVVFVLTVHGRAVRQVRRLINAIYRTGHFYYIHVDSRSHYLYRELLPLERELPNVRLARDRFATIWGGASLLQAHLTFMRALLAMEDWSWDYYLNLSESDYPLHSVDKLTMFLTKYKGNNFLKSHGRETPTFIKKQGLDFTFYECENHLWRLGRRELPRGVRFDGGSDWIVLYRDFCDYSVHSTDPLLTGLSQLYQYVLLPVESFFHTLLQNSQFCERWVDSNLHLTNWKRKQGCKCQHRSQVDWCGCSPNDLKPQDMDKLMKNKQKAVFFARKFEAIVSQEIINSLDAVMGRDLSNVPTIQHYWQNDYHHADPYTSRDDAVITLAGSLVRRTLDIFSSANPKCNLGDFFVLETNLLYVVDSFHRFLVLYNVTVPGLAAPVMLESQFSALRHYRIIDPLGPVGRLQNIEVGSDFDLKELLFRNYAGVLSPHSEVSLRHVWGHGAQTTVTSSWIDPAGVIAAYQDMNIPPEPHIGNHKPKLKTPLRPGVWTVKILAGLTISAEVKFVILPYSVYNQKRLSSEGEAVSLHGGPGGLYTLDDYSDLAGKMGVQDARALLQQSVINSRKVGHELDAWIDSLSEKLWSMQDTCTHKAVLGPNCPPLDSCVSSRWSSLTPDPKSNIQKRGSKLSL